MLRTLQDIKNLKGKRVLLRVDFNVPIDKSGVTDDTRIKETLPTIKFLLKKGCRLLVITHLGRPEGRVVDSLKLDAVATCMGRLLGKRVKKVSNCIGRAVEAEAKKMKNGEILLLENIRFHPEEEACEKSFTYALANLGDIFVNDAFAACHRKHASVYGVAKILPSYAGLLVEQEVKNLTPLLTNMPSRSEVKQLLPRHGGASLFARPLTLIVGGAKVDTKIGLLKNFFGKADHIVIGGALANTFLSAEGFDIGRSLFEKEKLETARELLMLADKRKQHIELPRDVVVADEITQYAKTLNLPLEDIEGNMKILDIGELTRNRYREIIENSKTIIWNGPMGLYEFTPFASGTKAIAQALAARKGKAKTYLGGGDTVDALKRCGIATKKFTFVSTGGGAMLEFLEGKKLPGIEVLRK